METNETKARPRQYFNVIIDAELKDRFKAICALQGITLQDGVERAIEGYLRENRKMVNNLK